MPGFKLSSVLTKGKKAPTFRKKSNKGVAFIGPNMKNKKILIFTSSSCPTCKRLIKSVDTFNIKQEYTLLFVISDNNIDSDYLKKLSANNVDFIIDRKLFDEYSITNTPYSVVVSAEGMIMDHKIIHSWKDMSREQNENENKVV